MTIPDTETILHQASQARRIAESMDRLNSVNLLGAASSIAAIWRGEAANAYLLHCETTRDHIRKITDELISIANDIERTARIWESTEDQPPNYP